MRALPPALLVTLSLLAAGCVVDDEPDESIETPPDDAAPDDGAFNATATPSPVPSPAPGDGGVETGADAPLVAPSPSADAPPAEPTPEPATSPSPTPPAPEPAPFPTPAATPPPSPPPASPTPAPTPEPTPEPTPQAWPREGSHVTIRGSASDGAPNTFTNASEWTATWTYRDGDWHGACEGSWQLDWYDDDQRDARGTFSTTFDASSPPHWPLFNTQTPPATGQEVETWIMWDCRIESTSKLYSGLQAHDRWGQVHNADDEQVAEENYSDFDAYWDPDTGLVLEWDWARRNSGTRGQVVSTDAPV